MSANNMCDVTIYTAKSLETLKCHYNLKSGWHCVHKLHIIGSSVDNILHRSGIYLGRLQLKTISTYVEAIYVYMSGNCACKLLVSAQSGSNSTLYELVFLLE